MFRIRGRSRISCPCHCLCRNYNSCRPCSLLLALTPLEPEPPGVMARDHGGTRDAEPHVRALARNVMIKLLTGRSWLCCICARLVGAWSWCWRGSSTKWGWCYCMVPSPCAWPGVSHMPTPHEPFHSSGRFAVEWPRSSRLRGPCDGPWVWRGVRVYGSPHAGSSVPRPGPLACVDLPPGLCLCGQALVRLPTMRACVAVELEFAWFPPMITDVGVGMATINNRYARNINNDIRRSSATLRTAHHDYNQDGMGHLNIENNKLPQCQHSGSNTTWQQYSYP